MVVWRYKKDNPYYSSDSKTLATRLDEAWDVYTSQSSTDEAKLQALDFMIYVFDLTESMDINRVLMNLMEERSKEKEDNPEYIPKIYKGYYDLSSKQGLIEATSRYHETDDSKVKTEFSSGRLLDVNNSDKNADNSGIYKTPMLKDEERAKFNVQIINGKFYQNGKLFDTQKMSAHQKKQWAAFTLNTKGELSVFKHFSGADGTNVHSSMNEGKPVLAAGELQIKDGKLISINTHSGHYKPSLYSTARFLSYLNSQGIDVSDVKVQLLYDPNKSQHNYKFNSVTPVNYDEVSDSDNLYYEVPASEVLDVVTKICNENIHSMNEYLNSSKTKAFTFLGVKSTSKKSDLANSFKKDMALISRTIKEASSSEELRSSLERLESIISNYEQKSNQITEKGRLQDKLSTMKKEIEDLRKGIQDNDVESKIDSFKNIH